MVQRFIGAGADENVSEASCIDRLKMLRGLCLCYRCFCDKFDANLFNILKIDGFSIDFDVIDQFQMIILFGDRVKKALI